MSIDVSGIDAVIASLNATIQQFESDVDQIVQDASIECRDEAKAVVQVDTGFCRDHIVDEHEHLQSSTTSQAPYSEPLEFGTSRSRPYPFMMPSFDTASQNMQDKLQNL